MRQWGDRWGEATDAVAVVADSGAVLYANPAFEHLYAEDSEAAAGVDLGELLAGVDGPLPWRERVESAGRERSTIERHVARSGVRVWVEVSWRRDGEEVVVRSRRADGRRVVEHTGELTELIAAALDRNGIGLWFDDGITSELSWSRRTREIYRHEEDAPATHASFFERIHPDDRARFGAEVQAVLTEKKRDFAFRFRVGQSDDDATHVVSSGAVRINEDGTMLLGVGAVRDESELVHARERIALLEAQLEQAQRLDISGRLASGIAHDFNNMLTGILGFAEVLRLSQLDDEQRADVAEIRDAVERASDLTGQLLSFVRGQPTERKRVAIDDTLAGACRLLRRVVPATVVIEHVSQIEDWRVEADAAQLHQVWSNLIINASHAMPDGGTITVRSRQVTTTRARSGHPPGDYVVVEIRDTGHGIAKDDLARIFEPFYTTKERGRGTGLGLAVVAGIVERHGGFIEVESEPGRGTELRVALPRAAAPARSTTPTPPPEAVRMHGENRTVLLVEDENMVRQVTRRLLEAEGFTVVEAVDGRDALDAVEGGTHFDLLLTDVIMPRMTGPDLVQRIRADNPALRVLFVSGYPAELVTTRFHLTHDTELLMKPYTRDRLLSSIARLLTHPR